MFDDEEFQALSPINFFQLQFDCHHLEPKGKLSAAKYALPETGVLCGEDKFADVNMGWNRDGIHLIVKVNQKMVESTYPDVARGDSVEIFIDTRDVKTSGYNTRFCHHFFFLPEAVDGHQAGEITRFRTEDVHELCPGTELVVKTTSSGRSYQMQIFIPNHCLHGYDPDQFKRMGFSYRINRRDGYSQHFSVVTEDFQVEQQPSLWSSARLIE